MIKHRSAVLPALAALALIACGPAGARELNADEAQRFVIGNVFTFTCYEGTTGEGRILSDGSAIGRIQLQGQGQMRYASVPAGTLRVEGERICAFLDGLGFQPCFTVRQTGRASFRGALAGFDEYFCNFERRTPGRREPGRGRSVGTPPATPTAAPGN